MAFQRKSRNTSVRLTGLFRSKRPGLFVGGARDQAFADLIAKVKEAKAAGRGITFFLWRNDPTKSKNPNGPPFSLSVDVEMERSKQPARKAIEPDDDFGETGGDDSLFGED